jgi:prevent-host-death family protein
MTMVNMLEAKTKLSKLVEAVESGAEAEVIIARNGKPAAKLVPLDAPKKKPIRLGMYDGMYPVMTQEEFDADNEEIAKLFYGDDE